MLWICVSWL